LSTPVLPSSRRRPLQLVIGVALVLLAIFGVVFANKLTSSSSPGGGGGKVSVVGARDSIPSGHTLVADDLVLVKVDAAPAGAATDRALVVGKITRQAIPSGAPITDPMLVAPAPTVASKLYFTLRAGYVAINVPPGDLSPYIQPGDQIDVITSLCPQKIAGGNGSGQCTQTKATLKGLRILSVGTPGTPTAGNLIVEVKLAEAEQLEFIIKNTDYTFALKSPLDSGPDPTTTGIDIPGFKSIFGLR
jgi:Flp pilus assembly protein CpaB